MGGEVLDIYKPKQVFIKLTFIQYKGNGCRQIVLGIISFRKICLFKILLLEESFPFSLLYQESFFSTKIDDWLDSEKGKPFNEFLYR